MADFTYRADQETPSVPVTWRDYDDAIIDFSSGYTFQAEIVKDGAIVDTIADGQFTGSATAPNVVLAWASGDLAALSGLYELHIRARDGSSQDRYFAPGNWPTIYVIPVPT